MALTQTQLNAKRAKKAAKDKARKSTKANDQVLVFDTRSNSSCMMGLDELHQQMRSADALSAKAIVERSSPTNVDFTMFADPVIRTKQLIIGGVQFQVNLFTDKFTLKILNDMYNKDFLAVFQIWNKGGSALWPLTRDRIADAGKNWEGKTVIQPNDILSRAVAALRMNNNNTAILHIASHIAYAETKPGSEINLYPGVNTLGIWQVWD